MMFFTIFTLFVSLNSLIAYPQTNIDCSTCTQKNLEIEKLSLEVQRTKTLFETNREEQKKPSNTDLSIQVKISSNIYLLSTKLETDENNLSLLKTESEKMGCNKCMTAK